MKLAGSRCVGERKPFGIGKNHGKPGRVCHQPDTGFEQFVKGKFMGVPCPASFFLRRKETTCKKGRVADEEIVLLFGLIFLDTRVMYVNPIGPRRCLDICACLCSVFCSDFNSVDCYPGLGALRQH